MHLGSRVSALLDGRLPLAEEERAWSHVHDCHPCRDLVEREGWIKTRLAGLSFAARPEREAPDRLKDALLGCGSALAPEPFATAVTTVRARHRSLVMIGGGAAGAAVMGVLALGAAGTPHLDRRAPVTNLSRSIPAATPVVNDRPAAPAKKRRPKQGRQNAADGALQQVVVLRAAPQATMAP